MTEPTLNDVLEFFGLRTTPGDAPYKKRIVTFGGAHVFTGDAHDVWQWLRDEYGYGPKHIVECHECEGYGCLHVSGNPRSDDFEVRSCDECGESGWLLVEDCKRCEGDGITERREYDFDGRLLGTHYDDCDECEARGYVETEPEPTRFKMDESGERPLFGEFEIEKEEANDIAF